MKPDLIRRLIFVVLALVVYRVGAHIPVPGLDPSRLAEVFGSKEGFMGLFNLFSGGALQRLTIFALGLTPYISASIMMQLMTAVIPFLEELKKEGGSGRRRIAQYTRYGALAIAVLQGFGMARYLVGSGVAIDSSMLFYVTTTLTLVAGTLFLMWLGEQITDRGMGNGVSLLIFAGIVSGLPHAVAGILEQVRQGLMPPAMVVLLVALLGAILFAVVYVERGQRRIPVHYPKRQVGRNQYLQPRSDLPLKVNIAGVIPPIFASTLLVFLSTIAEWFGGGVLREYLAPGQPAYLLIFAVGIVFFSFVYTELVLNPQETAENLKRSGGYIPGVRPGEQTAAYIGALTTRLTVCGALYVMTVSLLPECVVWIWHVPFHFGGTSLLIVVLVVMDFMAQLQSQLLTPQYQQLVSQMHLGGKPV